MTKQNLNIAEKFGFTLKAIDEDIAVGEIPVWKQVIRPKVIGGPRNIAGMFPRVKVKIDKEFQNFIDQGKQDDFFADKERTYVFFQTVKGANEDSDIAESFNITDLSTPTEILANIEYLSRHMSHFLQIPEDEEEVNFILGYAFVGSHAQVFYLEHELEGDTPEIHLHMKRPNMWGSDLPRGFARFKEGEQG